MKKINQLPRYRELVSLIPGGTVQFLDIALDLGQVPRLKTEYWEWAEAAPATGELPRRHLMCLQADHRSDRYIDVATGLEAVEPPQIAAAGGGRRLVTPSYSITAEKALECYLDQWVPLPFLRKEIMTGAHEARFRQGPSDWARVMVSPDTSGKDGLFLLTIAFDTVVEKPFDPEDTGIFPALRLDDVRDGAEFSLVHEIKHNSWFIDQEWVGDWLSDLFFQMLRKKSRGRAIDQHDREHHTEHLARYFSFLELLNASGVIPAVRIVDPARNEAIDVDLVLDIGNSRTTGMLIERRGSDTGLSNSAVLELRDLSQPGLRHSEPFGSNIAFVRQQFGDPNGFSWASGRRQQALQWPSVVRIGPEASRIALRSRRDEGQTTMSSPKRYLWDRAQRTQEWRYCPDSYDGTAEEPPVNSGTFIGFVNNFGTPLHALDDPQVMRDTAFGAQDKYPATEPMFSRSAIMMFLLSEVVSHALAQINSPAQRSERLNPDLARRLRTIILTVPPAMTIAERQIFERWANWTVETLWKALDWSENAAASCYFPYQRPPRIRCQWDEASTTQMVYVYNEVSEKFACDTNAYFEAFGRKREGRGTRSSLRVASLDIGGGTTDIIVTTYLDESSGATAILEPVQEFREGFNVAGDDILKAVIERHVLGALVAELGRSGLPDPADYLTRKVGKDVAGLSERDKNLRAQFAQQYSVPLGLHIMRLSEQIAMEDANGQVHVIRFGDVFDRISRPRDDVLAFIDSGIARSVEGFSLEKWEIAVDFGEVAATIDTVVAPVLGPLCEAVAAWDCDVLLLSGRPSCLPAVKAFIQRRPPVPPSRIVPMNSYRVENWYPFWSPGGLIADPKTTGVVGAMLCALSEGDLPNFRCNTSRLRPASTVKHLGQMSLTGEIKNDHLFFSGIDLDASVAEEQTAEFPFAAPIFIGFRQLPLERWKATPFYQLSFSSQNAKDAATRRGVPYQVSLKYRRQAIKKGASESEQVYDEGTFTIVEVTDRNGDSVPRNELLLELKTLRDESGYWLDTGLFDIQ